MYFPSKNSILAFKSSKEQPPAPQVPMALAPDLLQPQAWGPFSLNGKGGDKQHRWSLPSPDLLISF